MKMKKKIAILAVVLVILGCFCLTGCGYNRQLIDTNWSFKWAIVQLGNGELLEGEVTSWRDFDDSDCVQFTMNGITYLTHYSNAILCSERP